MVVFACSACGESLKKNQVENHYLRKCRNCNMLSCLDCGKDFWGNEYEQHTKCITEEEKYSGKNYVPKPGSNKNETKQQQWFQQVQEAVDKCRTNPRLKAILIRLKDQPNVPRKKNKFLNFLTNGFNVRNPNLVSQVWEVLMANTESKQQENNESNTNSENSSTSKTDNHSVNGEHKESSTTNNSSDSVETNSVNEINKEDSKKLSKREKKEERRKKVHKAEKKDKSIGEDDGESGQENRVSEKVSKKKSKRKDVSEESKTVKKSNKRKRVEDQEDDDDSTRDQSVCDTDAGDQSVCEDDTEQPAKKKFKTKFNWSEVVIEVLQTKGPEMKTKKLRKKVLSEYLSQGCTERSEEKLWAKFEKRLKKIPEVKVLGEKVKLKSAEGTRPL